MAWEIERKFLLVPGAWRPGPGRGVLVRQGYLSDDPDRTVRVRIMGREAFLTVKGRNRGLIRDEFEYPIPLPEAQTMLDRLCLRPLIEKRRHRERWNGRVWEIDVFEGENAGLTVAEVELPDPALPMLLPPWVGAEVSDDPRYYNSNLAKHPYAEWRNDP